VKISDRKQKIGGAESPNAEKTFQKEMKRSRNSR
jgi:hypothetical protein